MIHQVYRLGRVADQWRRKRLFDFFVDLDHESVRGFQVMYYWFIIGAGLYLALFAEGAPEPIAVSLGHPFYEGWVALNIICPAMTLIGRRMFRKVGKNTIPGAPNNSRAAASLMFGGDGGVWGLILVYTACLFNATHWGQPLYVTIYFLMGVPGGFMFTLRSWRRLRQIKSRERRLA